MNEYIRIYAHIVIAQTMHYGKHIHTSGVLGSRVYTIVYWQPSQNRFPANFNPLELQTVLNKIGAFHPSDMCGVLHVLLQHARERQKGIEMQRMMVQKFMLKITQMGPVISITAIFDERIMEIFFPIKSPIFRPSENEKWIFRQCAASK